MKSTYRISLFTGFLPPILYIHYSLFLFIFFYLCMHHLYIQSAKAGVVKEQLQKEENLKQQLQEIKAGVYSFSKVLT